jgi:hypothetical protein
MVMGATERCWTILLDAPRGAISSSHYYHLRDPSRQYDPRNLIPLCHLRNEQRTFRLDRIIEMRSDS